MSLKENLNFNINKTRNNNINNNNNLLYRYDLNKKTDTKNPLKFSFPMNNSLQISTNIDHHYYKSSNLPPIDIENNNKILENFKTKFNLNINSPIHNNKESFILRSQETFYTTNNSNNKKINYLTTKKNKNKSNKKKMVVLEKYIPGTKIKTIFNIEKREEFLYKKIFYYFQDRRKKFKRDEKIINNIINLDYAENLEAYQQRLIKKNNNLIKEGKKIKHFSGPNLSEVKGKELMTKAKFMKSVVDYSYPIMVLDKVKEQSKMLKIKNKELKQYPPFILNDIEKNNNEKFFKNYLTETINITNYN